MIIIPKIIRKKKMRAKKNKKEINTSKDKII